MWHFEGRTTVPRERGFPGGYLELILHLGARYGDVAERDGRVSPFPAACLTGVQTRPFTIEAPDEPAIVIGIRLRPVGAFAVLGHPVHEATGLTVDLADLIGHESDWLVERCRACTGPTDRFRTIAHWIAGRVARHAAADPAVAWAARRLESRHGATPIATLHAAIGVGRARFTSAFREQVGLSPKRYGLVLRFRRALELLHAGRSPSHVALDAGYYDQAHLTADFRAFAGMPPSAFAAAARYPNSTSLAEER
jgi:AraC-like DNA-binding protein